MSGISRTAAYVAAARAIGAREPDLRARNPDYLAERLLGDPARFDLDLPIMRALRQSYDEAMEDFEVAGTVRAMTVRARFIDDALEQAAASGATQVLVLGAGLDSHAYRFAPLLRNVRVFEVDRAAMLAFKQQRVDEVVGGPPPNLTYVAIDVQNENQRDVLLRHGYDFSQRSFVIMEGLTMYLPEAAMRETFAMLASHRAGSSVVFDFVSSALIEITKSIDLAQLPPAARAFAERFLHLTRDEPWVFGLPFNRERDSIEAFGFNVPEILNIGGKEAAERYLTRADGSQVGAEAMARAAQARAGAQAQAQAQAQAEAMTYGIAEAVVSVKH
jgi:methyltransferase (TIGR00027 family)